MPPKSDPKGMLYSLVVIPDLGVIFISKRILPP